MQNLVLIGMPGCGKSTCGVLAAKALLMDFIDTDLVLQQREKSSLRAIIGEKGNDYFAAAEEAALLSVDAVNSVIATGGSAVYSEKGMECLRKGAVVLYLRISFDTMTHRIADMESRGVLLRNGETVEAMFEERGALYEKYADRIIDCDGKETEQTVSAIVQAYRERA